MNKQEFLDSLRRALSGLPIDEIEERIGFYGEMIDDRMEEGLSEEEAVAAVGDIDEIVEQTVSELPLSKLVKKKIKPKRSLKVWEIVLIALGSPIWITILAAALVIILSLYAVLWSVVVSLWAVGAALAGTFLGGIALGVVYIVVENVFLGIALIGAALFCAGLAIFWYFGCMAATKGIVILTKKIFLGIKMLFVGKEKTK